MTIAPLLTDPVSIPQGPTQRARGSASLAVTRADSGETRIAQLRQAGSTRVVFPGGRPDPLQAVLVNTSGGVTGGDRFDVTAEVGPDASLTLTTQTAERAYRALDGQTGKLRNTLKVDRGGRLNWVPQETILFDRAALDRQLHVDLATDARFLMIEPLIFGRRAMGETVQDLTLTDRVRIVRDGRPIWRDGLDIAGNAEHLLDRPAIGNGARAFASIIYTAPDTEAQVAAIRSDLPEGAAVTLLPGDLLACRIVATGGFALRRAVLPILDRLTGGALPTCWRL